jgi:hypothetical protein
MKDLYDLVISWCTRQLLALLPSIVHGMHCLCRLCAACSGVGCQRIDMLRRVQGLACMYMRLCRRTSAVAS